MDLQRVGVVAPCDGPDDFPTYFQGDDASGLWAAWTAAWRPSLIAAAGRIPEVVSSYDQPPPEAWSQGLLLVTPPSQGGDATEWLDSVRSLQAPAEGIIDGFVDRNAIISAIDRQIPNLGRVSEEIEAEFFALAYAYLQVATLTHELEGGSVFSPELFEKSAVLAACAALASDLDAMHESLQVCYDQLHQTRAHSYPVDIHLLDVLLVAETTLGPGLLQELALGSGKSVMLPGFLAEQIAATEPDSLAALRLALEEGRASLLTGGFDGGDLSGLPPEAMLRQLRQGADAVERIVGRAPGVFAQHCSAVAPRLPQLLTELGFTGVLLAGFDGGDPPEIDHGRSTWVGLDGAKIDVVTTSPRDLGQVETLLRFSDYLNETLQHDHVATVLLAGWPGGRHEAYKDLRLVAQRSEVLGRLLTVDEYFKRAALADHWSNVDHQALGPRTPAAIQGDGKPSAAEERDRLAIGLADSARALVGGATDAEPNPWLRVANLLEAQPAEGDACGELLVNPWSFPIPASEEGHEPTPGLGFRKTAAVAEPSETPRAEGRVLRNEWLEATVNADTGGLQAVRTHDARGNRASQRLAATSRSAVGAQMRAKRVEVIADGPAYGAIRAVGAVVDHRGEPLAEFEQSYRLQARAEYLLIDLRVQPVRGAWGGERPAMACRFALGADAEQVFRGVQWTRLPERRERFVAGEYAEVVDGTGSLALAVDRPLQWRRSGRRRLEFALDLGSGEPLQQCFAIALNSRYPLRAALGALAPPWKGKVQAGGASPASGWWVHCDAANVLISHLSPAPGGGRSLTFRLVETEGRAASASLRLCRPVTTARLVGFRGEIREELPVVDGAAEVEIGPYGWLQVEASW